MAQAVVGDDAFCDDPQVAELEQRCAALLGKQDAVFTCSGTMSNQIAVRVLTRPGDEVILDELAHVHYFESAATAAAGAVLRPVRAMRGVITPGDVRGAVGSKARGRIYASPSLLVVENTIGGHGGAILPLDALRDLSEQFRPDLKIHLDGARLMNAAVATGHDPSEYGCMVDTVSMCFAKGLGAPFGSVLAGDRETVERARVERKWLGGGLHQAGFMAAAALYALDTNITRLNDDHDNAQLLAEMLDSVPGRPLCVLPVETNIVQIDVTSCGVGPGELASMAGEHGVLILPWTCNTVRAVTSLEVCREDIATAARVLTNLATRSRVPVAS